MSVELETEIWCPSCRESMGRVLRRMTESGWVHERTPQDLPPKCTRCETVLVRRS